MRLEDGACSRHRARVRPAETCLGVYLFHRHDFHKVLLDSLSPSVRICLDHRLMDYTATSTETTLTFSNGTTATCDLLIGADGLRSHVRRDMLGALATRTGDERYLDSIQPVFTGTYVYRGLVDADDLAKRHPGHQALRTPIQVSYRLSASNSSLPREFTVAREVQGA